MALGDGTFRGIGVMPTWEQINNLGMANTNNDAEWERLLHDATRLQSIQSIQAAAQAQAQAFPPNRPTTAQTMASRAREMFLKRMGGLRAEMKVAEHDFLQCHVYQDMVYLFYCFGGRDGCVKEGIDLFPSDTLITQFRLVLVSPE